MTGPMPGSLSFSEVADNLVTEYAKTDRKHPQLATQKRGVVIAFLTSCLANRSSLEAFGTSLVEALKRHGVAEDLRQLWLSEGPDLPIERVMEEGLDILSDQDLAWLAMTPDLLNLVFRSIQEFLADGELGLPWLGAMADEGMRGLEAEGRTASSRELIRSLIAQNEPTQPTLPEVLAISHTPTTSQPRGANWRRYVRSVLSVAASLLLGILIGKETAKRQSWFPPSGDVAVLNADVQAIRVASRGGESDYRVTITSDRPGFASIIALSPDQRQRVFPQERSVLRAPAESPLTYGPLPPNTERVMAVVTETPATETVRSALIDRSFTTPQSADLSAHLRRVLTENGHRWAAIGVTDLPAPAR